MASYAVAVPAEDAEAVDNPVRVGVLGLGAIGAKHARMAHEEVPGLTLAAVCDADEAVAKQTAAKLGEPAVHTDGDAMLASSDIDAVIVATPHSRHIVFAEPALKQGLHVLVEKPVAMTIEGAGRANAAFEEGRRAKPDLVYAAMFQQRLMPVWRRLREVLRDEVGPIQRVGWTVTDWFRTKAYYDSGGWRGTWHAEGGGVLMNQAPHNLDLLLWITGLTPRRVSAVTRYGRFHDVEVEDEVAATVEFDPQDGSDVGPIGTFLTSTGEAPGVNRLEIVGDRASVVAEDGMIRVRRLDEPASHVNATGPAKLRSVPYDEREEHPGPPGSPTYTDQEPYRKRILADFATCVRRGNAPVAPAVEGYQSVELANAMLLAGHTGQRVTLPLDATAYQDWLMERISEAAQSSS